MNENARAIHGQNVDASVTAAVKYGTVLEPASKNASATASLLHLPQNVETDAGKILPGLTLIIPAYNEENAIAHTVTEGIRILDSIAQQWEIIVVSDASTDRTAELARQAGARVLDHPTNMGYGNSIKTGIVAARHRLIAITDADGSYPLEALEELARAATRYDMAVGQRVGKQFYGGCVKNLGRQLQLFLVQFACGLKIPDVNSGLRIFPRHYAMRHFDTICGGFSFTTSITLSMLLTGMKVAYIPIDYKCRIGKSHVRYFRDTLRSLQIIISAILKYNPIKMFLLLTLLPALAALCSLGLGGLAYARGAMTLFLGSMILCAGSAMTACVLLGLGFLSVTVQTKDETSSGWTKETL